MESRQENPSPEIEFSILSIPNEADYGTGKYSIFIKPNVLLSPKVIVSIAINIPIFQISLKLEPATGEVTAVMGKVDGSLPLSLRVFLLPTTINPASSHEITADFGRWQVTELKIDKIKLTEKDLQGLSDTLPEKQFQGSPKLFFDSNRRLLEDLFGSEWFTDGKSKKPNHPAYKSWRLCQKLLDQHGNLRFPEDVQNLPKISRIVLDNHSLLLCSSGNVQLMKLGLFENYGDDRVRRKIKSVIQDETGFKSLMTELSYASWHISKRNVVTPYQEDSYPDFKVESRNFALPLVVDCKYILKNTNDSRFSYVIKKANKQIKKLNIDCYGLVVIDITELIGLLTEFIDTTPEEVVRISAIVSTALRNVNSSVSGVLLLWDDFTVHGNPQTETDSLVAYRRRYYLVKHKQPIHPLPENLDLDEIGLTYGFTFTYWVGWNKNS